VSAAFAVAADAQPVHHGPHRAARIRGAATTDFAEQPRSGGGATAAALPGHAQRFALVIRENESGLVIKRYRNSLPPGRIVALDGEAGYQAQMLPPATSPASRRRPWFGRLPSE
jgi:hypothetical protein